MKNDIVERIAWHPGFIAAASLELKDEVGLTLISEYNLSKEPLRVDLYIKNDGREPVKNEIGRIFKKYNLIEYKNPTDALNIDVLYKIWGYAAFFKSLGAIVDYYPSEEITVSIFRDTYPRDLLKLLKRNNFCVTKPYDGIYYIQGNVPFTTQIVVTGQLDKKHSSLRVLSDKTTVADFNAFIAQAKQYTNQGDLDNVNAIINVIKSANSHIEEVVDMHKVWLELFPKEFGELEEYREKAKKADKLIAEKAKEADELIAKQQKVHEEQIQNTAIRLCQQGFTNELIAQVLDVSQSVVETWLRNMYQVN